MENKDKYSMKNIIDLYNNGQIKEMIVLAEENIREFPQNIDAKNILALGLKKIGKFEESKKIFFDIINDYKNDPVNNKKIAFIYTNAANLLFDIGQIDNAIKLHEIAIRLNKKSINSFLGLGLAYSNKGMDNKSIDIYKSALELNKNDNNINYNLATSLRKVENYKEAAHYYSLTSRRLSKSFQLECLYFNIKDKVSKNDFYKLLNEITKTDKSDPLIASISKHSSIRFGRNDRCNFCRESFDYIKKENLFNDMNFDQSLINQILDDIEKSNISKKPQSLLNDGIQSSGNLFNLEYRSIQKLKKIIINKINNYRLYYEKSDSDFIKKWPKKFNLYGWIIIMNNGGNLLPHIHKEGWLSSSIYLKRPEKRKSNDGDIKFSLHGGNYPSDNMNFPSEIIDIEEGDMVMFPSSIFHSTIPFDSDRQRITLAFDVIPLTI